MKIFRDLESARAACRPPIDRVATVGIFDGIHIGHRRLLSDLRSWAEERRVESAVVTFSRHPREVLGGAPPLRVLSLEHRLLLLERAGVDRALVLDFDLELSRWSAAEFARRVLREGLSAHGLLMGFDTTIGHRRAGSYEHLRALAPELGLEVRRAAVETLGGERVSSTLVRRAVHAGDLPRLEALLGRRFSLLGRVVHGDGRGRRVGFATANLDVGGAALPPAGVYFAEAIREDGTRMPAVANIGRRPTFAPASDEAPPPSVEAHLLDFTGDLYGERLELELLAFRRPEKKFASIDALRAQIESDIEASRAAR